MAEQLAVRGLPVSRIPPQRRIKPMRRQQQIGFALGIGPVAGPGVFGRMLHDACPNGIECNVAPAERLHQRTGHPARHRPSSLLFAGQDDRLYLDGLTEHADKRPAGFPPTC